MDTNNYDYHANEGFRRMRQYQSEAANDMRVNQAKQTADEDTETTHEIRSTRRPFFIRLVSALTGKA